MDFDYTNLFLTFSKKIKNIMQCIV